jgi:hypothetical protein
MLSGVVNLGDDGRQRAAYGGAALRDEFVYRKSAEDEAAAARL